MEPHVNATLPMSFLWNFVAGLPFLVYVIAI